MADANKPKEEKNDPNVIAHDLIRKATGTGPVNGEDLLGSPELKEQLRRAKERESARKKKSGS